MKVHLNNPLIETKAFQLYPNRINLQFSLPVTKQVLSPLQGISSYRSSDVRPLYAPGNFTEIEWTDET